MMVSPLSNIVHPVLSAMYCSAADDRMKSGDFNDSRKKFLNSLSSGMCGSTKAPPSNTVLHDLRLLSSRPRLPTSHTWEVGSVTVFRCSATASISAASNTRATTGRGLRILLRNPSTAGPMLICLGINSSISWTLIPRVVASDRNVATVPCEEVIRAILVAPISYPILARDWNRDLYEDEIYYYNGLPLLDQLNLVLLSECWNV